MKPMCFGERVTACLTEAGYPPSWTGSDEFCSFAHWDLKPPTDVVVKATEVAGCGHVMDPDAYAQDLAIGLRINLEHLGRDRRIEAAAKRGGRIIPGRVDAS